MGWTTGVRITAGLMTVFSHRHRIQTDSGANPASSPMGMGGGGGCYSRRIIQPGREADHSPPCSTEGLKLRGAISPFPQYVLMAWYLVKYRKNFTFTSFGSLGLRHVNKEN
jgi:hypothetical protein